MKLFTNIVMASDFGRIYTEKSANYKSWKHYNVRCLLNKISAATLFQSQSMSLYIAHKAHLRRPFGHFGYLRLRKTEAIDREKRNVKVYL